ncbi:MAG: hypothetical protein AAFP77_15760 [Bacteroidota bacterium]
MENFKSNHIKSARIMIIVFVAVSITLHLQLSEPIVFYPINSLALTLGLFFIFSKSNVREVSIFEDSIKVKKYERPFQLVVKTYSLSEIICRYKEGSAGEITKINTIYGEDKNGEILFVFTSRFWLWDKDQLDKIFMLLSAPLAE